MFGPAGVLLLSCAAAWGQTETVVWDNSTGNWSQSNKWHLGTTSGPAHNPTTNDFAIMYRGDLTVDAAGEEARELTLGWGTGNAAVFRMAGGSLDTVGSIYMGRLASGTAYHTAGDLTVGASLVVGETSGGGYGYGEYQLGGGLLTTGYTLVSAGAPGVFHHAAGRHEVLNDLTIAGTSGSEGTYHLGGTGALQALNVSLGHSSATAVMNQSGGTNTITERLLFNNNGDAARYHLTGGQLDIGLGVNQGLKYGKLVLDGGILTSGGSVDPGVLVVGDKAGTAGGYTWTGMAAHPGNLQVGYAGTGTFTQASGSINASNFDVAYEAGSKGTAAIQGAARLHTLYQNVGRAGLGAVVQTGGTNTMTYDMNLGTVAGGDGAYTLGGGRLAGRTLQVGVRGTGVFQATGGELSYKGIQVGGFEGSSGRMDLSGTATVHADTLTVGYDAAADALLDQAAGAVVVTTRTRVVSGQYHLAGGSLVMQRGTARTVEIGTYGSGAAWMLGNADGTATVGEQGSGNGVGLTVSSAGSGTLRGWGTVSLGGTLDNSGRVVADGYGTSRDLDLTAFGAVASSAENGSSNGWYAVSKGRLRLPTVHVAPGFNQSYNWGEAPDDTSPDMVNSVRMTYAQVLVGGTVDISLLAPDHDLVPDDSVTGGDVTLIAGFDFLTSDALTFTTVDLSIRYDDAAVAAAGLGTDLTAADLSIYKTVQLPVVGKTWVDVTSLGVTVDVDTEAKTITLNDVPGYSSFAVGVVPEPGLLLPLGLLSWFVVRRVRRRCR